MDFAKYYARSSHSDAAIILLLGSSGNNLLTKGVAKWLVGQGINALSLGPEDGVIGYHNFHLSASMKRSKP